MRLAIILAASIAAGSCLADDAVDPKTAQQIFFCTEKVGDLINKRYGDPRWIRISSGDGKALWMDSKTRREYESVECDPKGIFILKSWRKLD